MSLDYIVVSWTMGCFLGLGVRLLVVSIMHLMANGVLYCLMKLCQLVLVFLYFTGMEFWNVCLSWVYIFSP